MRRACRSRSRSRTNSVVASWISSHAVARRARCASSSACASLADRSASTTRRPAYRSTSAIRASMRSSMRARCISSSASASLADRSASATRHVANRSTSAMRAVARSLARCSAAATRSSARSLAVCISCTATAARSCRTRARSSASSATCAATFALSCAWYRAVSAVLKALRSSMTPNETSALRALAFDPA